MKNSLSKIESIDHDVIWASILNSISSEIAIIDPDGTILAVNQAWIDFLSNNSADPNPNRSRCDVGANYFDVCQCDSAFPTDLEEGKSALKGIKSVISGSLTEFTMEYPCHSPTEKRWFLLSAKNLKGKISGVVISHTNITSKVKAEIELKNNLTHLVRTSKLAALGELCVSVAHEINNPLSIILGSVGLMVKNREEPQKFLEKATSIEKSCNRISKIVNGLRKFSRQNDTQLLKKVSLNCLINEVLTLVDPKATQSHVKITSRYETNLQISCIENELEQVFINLINNAIDAIKDLSEKWISISVFEDDHFVVIHVIDSGAGIPEAARANLFEMFYTTKPEGEGTGLGLSISRRLLEGMGATIGLRTDCLNTCFELRFPKVDLSISSAC